MTLFMPKNINIVVLSNAIVLGRVALALFLPAKFLARDGHLSDG